MPSERFRIANSRHEITVEERRIAAHYGDQGSFFPALSLHAEVVHNLVSQDGDRLPYTFLQAKGSLSFDDHNVVISESSPLFVARSIVRDGTETQLNFRFPLDPHRVAGIEEHRSGSLGLGLRVEFMYKMGKGQFDTAWADVEVDIAQSRWVNDVLPNLGAGQRFIVEIPRGKQEIKDAWRHISQAERAFSMRDLKSGATHCREAGSALNSYVQGHLPGTFAYQESWKRAYRGFNRHCSLYIHEEDQKKRSEFEEGEMSPAKPDAEHLLLRVKALAKYAEELRQRRELKVDS